MVPCHSSHRKQHWDLYNSFILLLTVFLAQSSGCVFLGIYDELAWHDWKQTTLKAGHGWKQTTLKAGTWALACDASACWIPTGPPPYFRESLSLWGLGQGARLGSLLLLWGQQRCFTPPFTQEGESGSGEWGLGLHPAEPQPPALTPLCHP